MILSLRLSGLEGIVDESNRLLLFDSIDSPLLTHPRLRWQLGVSSLQRWSYLGRPLKHLSARARWNGFITYPHHVVLAAINGLAPQLLTSLDSGSPEDLISLLQLYKPSRLTTKDGNKLNCTRANIIIPPRPQAVLQAPHPSTPPTSESEAPPSSPLTDSDLFPTDPLSPSVWDKLGLVDSPPSKE